ncbi:ATP-dependent nuclease [Sinorhizobium meliloti]|uniref:ATP-dependent nuclease n=1 Tax=Rhizobium meliloti TaxID=382 RepID=UPI003F17B541
MKLERIFIANFRCFGPNGVTVNLQEGVTAFVGNNGSGKTAIFSALGKIFGTTAALRSISKRDFHRAPEDDELESGVSLEIDCIFGFPATDDEHDEGGQGGEDNTIPEVFNNMSISDEGEPVKVRMRLQATWTDDGTPEGYVEEELRWVDALDDEFEWDECEKVKAVERNFVQLVYVPASRNAYDQVTNLLKGRLWKAARWSDQLEEAVTEAADTIQARFEDERPASFISERLERRWHQVHRGDTNSNPSLRLVDQKLSDLVRRAEFVFSDDVGPKMLGLDELSDGQRSLFHIALTAATLEIENDAFAEDPARSPFDPEKLRRTYLTLLAIEEPENSLSPFFLSRIMSQARDIGQMSNAQVLMSSHSASILSRVDATEVRYCRLNMTTRMSSVRPLRLPRDGTEANNFIRLAVKSYPELYFAKFVILAEGDSEIFLIPRIAEAMGAALDKSFVPVVPLGGRFVRHFWRLLNDLRIPHATLLDLDLGRQHGGAVAIQNILAELERVDRTLDNNPFVLAGDVDPDEVNEIEDSELLSEDQKHPWLRALRHEGIFFSSPIDIDFAMLQLFDGAYKRPRPGGRGPKRDEDAIAVKKAVTLKTGGDPDLYGEEYDDGFTWYPYLFLSDSKPQTHISAVGRITSANLARHAPVEIRELIAMVRAAVGV